MNSMLNIDKSRSRGFTIIEVALVLAIAGLIFLVVFLALPALQNSQRDTAKRQAVGQAVAALQSYESDNGGILVSAALAAAYQYPLAGPISNYTGKLPANLSLTVHSYNGYVLPDDNMLEIVGGAVCGTDATSNATRSTLFGGTTLTPTATKTVDRTTDAAVAVKLSGGNYYCKDI